VRQFKTNAWVAAVVSGVLQVLVFPTPNLYFLCWIAYAPLLLAVLRAREPGTLRLPESLASQSEPASPGQAFLLGWVAGTIWSFGTCYWIYHVMHSYGGLEPPVAFGVLILFSFYIGLFEALFALLLALVAGPRGWSRRALLAAPFLWVGVELFRAKIVGFPWDLLGTAQVDNIPLALIARATGVYGVSFEIMLVNAAFASALLLGPRSRRRLLISTSLVAVAVQCGIFFHPGPQPATKIARLVQQNIPILDSWSPGYFQATLESMTELSLASSPQQTKEQSPVTRAGSPVRPSVIIWPESPAPYYVNDSVFRSAVANLARAASAYVIVGSVATQPSAPAAVSAQGNEIYNSAALITPGGEWAGRYDKIHLVPFGEYVPFQGIFSFAHQLTREVGQFSRGTTRNTLDLGSFDAGVFICYESIFPGEVREFAVHGAELFVNISNDGWFGETAAPYQHLNQARMRAIENGRWLLRSTNTGITASIDPFGRVVARAPRNVREAIDAPFGVVGETTFYTRHGDWFPFSCAIISLAAILARRIGTLATLQ
jgi:apolipoprotein N-acyltransferase